MKVYWGKIGGAYRSDSPIYSITQEYRLIEFIETSEF